MSRRGFVIPLVLIFSAILAVLGTFIIKNTSQYNAQNRTGLSQLQAHFVARAAFQHAMLKIKLLHRELYDAACLSQALNPLFDFTNINYSNLPQSITALNPGPIFLYPSGSGLTHTGVYTTGVLAKYPKADAWLKAFEVDIASGWHDKDTNTDYNNCMSLNPLPATINNLIREPFYGQYQMTNIKQIVLNTKEDSSSKIISNYAIIEMTVSSTINNAKDKAFDYTMKKTVRVTRDAM